MIAIALPILYFPSVFICVVAFIHFTLFLALIIVNVFIKDLDPGNGARTNVSRIIWGCKLIEIFSNVHSQFNTSDFRALISKQSSCMSKEGINFLVNHYELIYSYPYLIFFKV